MNAALVARATLAASLFALVACGSSSSGGSPGGTTPPGPGADGGTLPDGAPAAASPRDADDEHGAEWDGTIGSARLLVRAAYEIAVTADEELVYSTETDIRAVPVAGGASTSIATARYAKLRSAGRAALIMAEDSTAPVGVWSRAGGYSTITSLHTTNAGNVDVTPNTSGDLVLLRDTPGGISANEAQNVVLLTIANVSSSVLAIPDGITLGACAARGEGFVCHGTTKDKKLAVVAIEGKSARVIASIPDDANPTEPVLELGDAVIVHARLGVHRVPYDGSAPTTLTDANNAILLQDGFVATDVLGGGDVKIFSKDGASSRTVAKNARIAQWLGEYNRDAAPRLRWLPICDVDAQKKPSNLRFYDPRTEKTVPVSTSCQVAAMTFSDEHAVFFDNWVPSATGTISAGDGDPMIADLRDGTKRAIPADPYSTGATPIEKGKLLFYAENPAAPSTLSFYDTHSPASAKAAPLPTPLDRVKTYELVKGGGVFQKAEARELASDVYFVAF